MFSVTYHEPGDRAADLNVGDILLTRGTNWYSKLIRFGQWFNGQISEINHAALYAGPGQLSEALSEGIVRTELSKYDDHYYAAVRFDTSPHDMIQILKYIKACETGRIKYGWLTLVSLALTMGVGSRMNFGVNGTLICSGYVAMARLRAGEVFKYKDANFTTPADLAEKYGVDFKIF